MFARVHTEKKALKSNTGSCTKLAEYLSKENESIDFYDQELFFNDSDLQLTETNVIESIDNNVKGLGKDDYKFFMISVNPSQNELKHLASLATGRDIDNISKLSKAEFKIYQSYFKNYVNNVMNDYAGSFNRGLTNKDLLYFAKVEQTRTYKGFDKAVKEGKAKSGQLKEGLQTHAHIVVSRKTADMQMKISPAARSRGISDKHKLNGKKVQVGFDNMNFKLSAENTFDSQFGYKRRYYDKAYTKMTVKNPGLTKTLNNIETVLDRRKAVNKILNKALENNETAKTIVNKSILAKTVINPKSLKGLTMSIAAKSNPVTAVAQKVFKIAKKVKHIVIDKGIDI